MYLLDTTFCSRIIGKDPAIDARLADIDPTWIRTSIITRGELIFMAYNSDRVDENLPVVLIFLSGLAVVPIDELTATIYGQIKAAILARFGPKERERRRRFSIQSLGFVDNHIWIASIAIRHDLTVVTEDSDFERIAEVSELRHESWLTSGTRPA